MCSVHYSTSAHRNVDSIMRSVQKRCRVKGKAQISVEYLIIVGLAFAVIIPAAYFFYTYTQDSNEEAVRSQINQVGNEILLNAESIYGLADGSLVTVTLQYPKNIRDIYVINQKELIIHYELSSGRNDAVFFSRIPLSGAYATDGTPCNSFPCMNSTFSATKPQQGKHTLRLESRTNFTLINMTV